MGTRRGERGQILVLFALSLVAMVAMVGLVLDGGSTFGQRRGEQNAADLAALAGATTQVNGGTDATIKAAAWAVAKANGYDDVSPDIAVTVTQVPGTVKVEIAAPHKNYFAGIVGLSTWSVSVTATAAVGVPTQSIGSAPITFNIGVFGPDGLPYSDYGCVATVSVPCTDADAFDFTKTQGSGSDAPLALTNMAWTNLGTGNVSSAEVKSVLDGSAPITAIPALNQYIGQANNGVHNSLFDDPSGKPDSVQTVLAGMDVIVPIIGIPIAPATQCVGSGGLPDGHTNGCFRGWALFHVVSATKNGGGEDGKVTGYFKAGFSRTGSAVGLCTNGTACVGYHGVFVLKLVN